MSTYKIKGKGWGYRFTVKGNRYTASAFPTKREAQQAEVMRRDEVKTELTPKQYEEFLDSLYREIAAGLPVDVFLRRKFKGRSGQRYIIDLGFEFDKLGVHYLTLIEAKYYKRTIEVGEVLEFWAKLDDIGANKGIIVTTAGFQLGAQKVASANRIALVVCNPTLGGFPITVLPKYLRMTAEESAPLLERDIASRIGVAVGLRSESRP